MDQRDPAPPRVARRGGGEGLAVEVHLAAIGLHFAGKHVHERALPRPVLAEQAQDLTRTHGEIDAIECERRAVALGDAVDLQPCGHCPVRYLSIGGLVSSFDAG
jgi:hypothetical protein